MRITDLIERGLVLALREKGEDVPTHHLFRLVLADLDAERVQLLMRLVAWQWAAEEGKLDPLEEMAVETCAGDHRICAELARLRGRAEAGGATERQLMFPIDHPDAPKYWMAESSGVLKPVVHKFVLQWRRPRRE